MTHKAGHSTRSAPDADGRPVRRVNDLETRAEPSRAVCAKAALPLLAFSAVCLIDPPASAECATDEPAWSTEWVFAQAGCKLKETATDVATELAKDFLAMALDSYVPGAAAMLGLEGGDRTAEAIIAEMTVQTDGLHDHVQAFWEWARQQNNANTAATFAATQDGISRWYLLTTDEKVPQIGYLSKLLSDVTLVRMQMQLTADPSDRIKWLHSYATVVDAELVLDAEYAAISSLSGRVGNTPISPSAYLAALSVSDRETFDAEVLAKANGNRHITLFSPNGNGVFAFFGALHTVMQQVRDRRFGDVLNPAPHFLTCNNYSILGSYTDYWWEVDADSAGSTCRLPTASDKIDQFCGGQNHGSSCPYSSVTYGSQHVCAPGKTCSNLSYWGWDVSYDVGLVMSDASAAFPFHKWLLYGDMLIQGYGPLRRKLDLWYRSLYPGWLRTPLQVDKDLDAYLRGTTSFDGQIMAHGLLGSVTPWANGVDFCAFGNAATPQQLNVAFGYSVTYGAGAATAVCWYRANDFMQDTSRLAYQDYVDVMLTAATSSTKVGAYYIDVAAAKAVATVM